MQPRSHPIRRPAAMLFPAALLAIGAGAGVGCRGHAAAAEPVGAGPATRVHLEVSGRGAAPATYDVSAAEVACTRGLVGPGSWGVQYTGPSDVESLRSFQLVVDSGTSDRRFSLGVVIGRFSDGAAYAVDTRGADTASRGAGRVIVRDSGGRGSLDVDARTADSVRLAASVACERVRRLEPAGAARAE